MEKIYLSNQPVQNLLQLESPESGKFPTEPFLRDPKFNQGTSTEGNMGRKKSQSVRRPRQ
jgi:hypothetical protein